MADLSKLSAAQLEDAAHSQHEKIRSLKAEIDTTQEYLLEIHTAWRVRGLEERLDDAKRRLRELEAKEVPEGEDIGKHERQIRATENEIQEVTLNLEGAKG